MYHVRDGITQFLYKFWGLTIPAKMYPQIPLTSARASMSSCQLFPSPHLERNRLSSNCVVFVLWGRRVYRCQPTCGDNFLSEACGLSCRESVMTEAAIFEWHFVIEMALSPHFFSFMNIDEWAVPSF